MYENKEVKNRCNYYGSEEGNEFFGMEGMEGMGEGFGAGFDNEMGENGQGAEFAEQGIGAQGFGGPGPFQGQGCGCPQGQTRRYTTNNNVNGRTCNINNRYYYDNYYNRYNRYCVNDVNYVKRYVRDINVWYYTTRTIDCGTQYLGTTNIHGGCHGGGAGAPGGCKCGGHGAPDMGGYQGDMGNSWGHGCGCHEEYGF